MSESTLDLNWPSDRGSEVSFQQHIKIKDQCSTCMTAVDNHILTSKFWHQTITPHLLL
jgi:hypothetical protein